MARYTVIYALVACVLIVGALATGYKNGPKCNNVCPRIRAPVCGKNSKGEFKYFDNPCVMEYENCLKKDYYAETDLSNCPA
ncbi:Hypothetical predicted protein [Cloeon dipterum]|uniref:Kazal-like domain-containing protein n=1 Tax=Cloeon dipterum TaxID=197152 RepID=A0A8S1DQY4_9INSE|nr:Hypothetical predicted protein [Cloeon dipterum]